MEIMWPAVIAGIVMIIAGIIIILNKKRLASGIAEAQRVAFGSLGEKFADQARPSGALAAGIGFVCIGVIAIIMGLTISPTEW
jgi:hypothetical protein